MENPYETPETVGLAVSGLSGGNGVVSNEVIGALQMTKGWVRFLAVLGFVMTGFMVIGAFGIMFMANRALMGGVAVGIGLAYLVSAVLNFFAAFKLNQYATRIGDLLMSRSEISLVAAMEAQRGFWKYVGILAIVVIGIYILGIGAAVMG